MADFHNKITSRINNRPVELNSPLSKPHIVYDREALLGRYDTENIPEGISSEGGTMNSLNSSTSSKSGPSPKRNRVDSVEHCPSLLIMAKQPSQDLRASRATEGCAAKRRRQPLKVLGSASQNEVLMSSTKALTWRPELPYSNAAVETAQENRDDTHETMLADISFSSSNILTSTNDGRSAELGDPDPGKLDNETTVDI